MKGNWKTAKPAAIKDYPVDTSKCPFGQAVSFHVTNCTAAQAQFLGELSQLFCDPDKAHLLDALQHGTLVIGFGPNGRMNLFSNPAALAVIHGDPRNN